MTETKHTSKSVRARHNSKVANLGLIILFCLLPLIALPGYLPGSPPLPWPVLFLLAILALWVGIAIFRSVYDVNPLVLLFFKLVAVDTDKECDQTHRGDRF